MISIETRGRDHWMSVGGDGWAGIQIVALSTSGNSII